MNSIVRRFSSPAAASVSGRCSARSYQALQLAKIRSMPQTLRRPAFSRLCRRPLFCTSQYTTGGARGTSNNSSSGAGGARRGGAQGFPSSPAELTALLGRAEEAREVLQEAVEIALKSGPQGIARTVKAAEAVSLAGAEFLQGDRAPPPVLLRKLFERLGATYVKLGQFIASSPTLFPEEYVLEFQKCLDSTPAVPFDVIRGIIEQELGKPISQTFESLDTTPLASASIAQVHKGILKGSQKEVVIKVLKPDVSDVLSADLSFLYVAARVLELLNPELKRTSLAAIVGDIRTSMLEEVDFQKEQANIFQFQDYLDRMNLRDVATAPYVYPSLSTSKVMTMEYLKGVPLTDFDAVRRVAPQGDPETTLINALNTWTGSILACDSFHADVHAGNLLALADGRVAFIDFGIVGRISPSTWGAVQALLGSAGTGDYRTVAQALAQMGATKDEVDVDAFARDLQNLYEELSKVDTTVVVDTTQGELGAGVLVDETQINRLVLDIVQVGETHGIRFPREFGLLLKQMLYFDRYTQLLAPELEVLNDTRIQLDTGLLQ